MTRYCSMLLTAILLSGCGNFLGAMGEKMSSSAETNKQKQSESARQRPDLK